MVRVLKKVSGASLVILLSGASVAFAALTLSGTSVVSDGALTLTGSGASTMDIGSGTLSLQTTNNGAITLGTGLLTLGGPFVAVSSTVNGLLSTNTLNVSSTAVVTGTFTLGGGSALTKFVATSTSWNPGLLNPGAATSTEIAIGSGFVSSSPCMVALSTYTSTSTAQQTFWSCSVGTSTIVVTLQNHASSSAVVDYANGTLKIQQFQ